MFVSCFWIVKVDQSFYVLEGERRIMIRRCKNRESKATTISYGVVTPISYGVFIIKLWCRHHYKLWCCHHF